MTTLADDLPNSSQADPTPVPMSLSMPDIGYALTQGWQDFRKAPIYGVVFASVYVIGGLFLVFISSGFLWQTVILALGFPLFAPFAAVAFYEVSRRLERGDALEWPGIIAVIAREKNRQIPWLGGLIVIYFLFYSFLAHMIFALFMGFSTMTNVSSSWDVFLSSNGLTMLAVQLVIGAVLGFLLFAMTVISLPLTLDKEIDFVTAMILSIQVVLRNAGVMVVWALVIGVLSLVALVPLFFGLLVVLPVLGHASWHMYRRALSAPAA